MYSLLSVPRVRALLVLACTFCFVLPFCFVWSSHLWCCGAGGTRGIHSDEAEVGCRRETPEHEQERDEAGTAVKVNVRKGKLLLKK
jgi:hypothetical protein